jgi:trimeric autotransporter adhesin
MVLLRAAIAFLILAGSISLPALAQQYTISTYAGRGAQPPGMGVAFFIRSITTDAAGNVYFANAYNVPYPCICVFKLDTSGNLTRIAGGEQAGFAGDGGPAEKALLNDPVGLAVDSAGDLFIAEGAVYDISPWPTLIATPEGGFHERVRKVTPDGIINTVAGGGVPGFSGDGGPATSASFFGLSGIAVDSAGNLYIADGLFDDGWYAPVGNNRIRKVTPDGIINTVAGTGDQGFSGDGGPALNAQLNGPQALTVDNAGNLFFSDLNNSRIRKLSTDGTISTVVDVASQMPNCVLNPNFYQVCSVTSTALDPSGNLVFSYFYCNSTCFPNSTVFKQSPNGAIATVLGSTVTQQFGLYGPIAIDAVGNLWFSGDLAGLGSSLSKVAPDGSLTVPVGYGACCGGGDGGPATSAQFQQANGVAADASGNLFIADSGNHRIRQVMPGGIITTAVGPGNLNINCDALTAAASSPPTATELCLPSQVAVDGAGNIFFVDRNRIRKVSPDGTVTSIAGDGTIGSSTGGDGGPASQALAYPNSVAVDPAGNVYFAEWARVRKISQDGTITTVAGTGNRPANGDAEGINGSLHYPNGGSATLINLLGPSSVAVDRAGNVYFADPSLVRKVSADGTIATVAGGGNPMGFHPGFGDGGPAINAFLYGPNGVSVDNAGNLYISEYARVRKVTTDGIINTIAGTQNPGYSGDGGLATQAQLGSPTGLTVDAAGNVYFADSFNNVIRVLRPAQ